MVPPSLDVALDNAHSSAFCTRGVPAAPIAHWPAQRKSPLIAGFPIGVPRFELGTSPTRTERATRLRHTPSDDRLAQERFDGVGARRRPLADQQVAAVGDHAHWRAESPRILEC